MYCGSIIPRAENRSPELNNLEREKNFRNYCLDFVPS
jgi:hypothetical protein